MKKSLVLLIGASLLTGCLSTHYEAPDGTVMTRRAFGTITDFESLEAQAGDRSIKIQGYHNDQVETARAIAEGISRGLSGGQ